jgi:hypothetical protein
LLIALAFPVSIALTFPETSPEAACGNRLDSTAESIDWRSDCAPVNVGVAEACDDWLVVLELPPFEPPRLKPIELLFRDADCDSVDRLPVP